MTKAVHGTRGSRLFLRVKKGVFPKKLLQKFSSILHIIEMSTTFAIFKKVIAKQINYLYTKFVTHSISTVCKVLSLAARNEPAVAASTLA